MKVAPWAVLAAALAIGSPVAAQEAKQDFKIMNRTGYAINEAYLAPAKTNEWQEDFLGKYQLDNGDVKKVHFSPKTKTCRWDLRVVYTDDDENVVWRDIDLCTVDTVTLYYDRKTKESSAKFD